MVLNQLLQSYSEQFDAIILQGKNKENKAIILYVKSCNFNKTLA
jgi:hypothetical protein